LSPVSEKRKTWSKIILSIVRKDQGSLLLPKLMNFQKRGNFEPQIYISDVIAKYSPKEGVKTV